MGAVLGQWLKHRAGEWKVMKVVKPLCALFWKKAFTQSINEMSLFKHRTNYIFFYYYVGFFFVVLLC